MHTRDSRYNTLYRRRVPSVVTLFWTSEITKEHRTPILNSILKVAHFLVTPGMIHAGLRCANAPFARHRRGLPFYSYAVTTTLRCIWVYEGLTSLGSYPFITWLTCYLTLDPHIQQLHAYGTRTACAC